MVAIFGIVTLWLPSLGVEADKVVKVTPPSVVSKISTFAQLTGAAVVPATFQVMVCIPIPKKVTAVLGDVTKNGPAAATVVTVFETSPVQPAVATLSLTVTLKFIALPIEGNTSHVGVILFNTSVRFGKYLVGDDTGFNDLNTGPEIFVDAGGIV